MRRPWIAVSVAASVSAATSCASSGKNPFENEAGTIERDTTADARGGGDSGGGDRGGGDDRGDASGESDANGDASSSPGPPEPAASTFDAAAEGSTNSDGCTPSGSYDTAILCDQPVAFWALSKTSGNEPDLTGNGNTGTYMAGVLVLTSMPNGDRAVDFDGTNCAPKPAGTSGSVICPYLTIPSTPSFSIPTTGNLTWEGWIRPDVLQFPHDDGVSGYVDWMGKCESYAPTCEWEARMYDTTTKETPNRPNRLSAYVFNPGAGLGSAADWQPLPALIQAGQWYHIVGEYTTLTQPSDCPNGSTAPGSINIWVNGIEWNHSYHGSTGCMSQYNVVPNAKGSAVNIGTMSFDSWFQGAIGKVAIYNYLLTPAQIVRHYQAMTGNQPSGNCADSCSL